jgi:hypothetical protein
LQDIELARISQEATERFYKLAVRRALQGERMRRLHRLRRTIRPAHQRDFGRNARRESEWPGLAHKLPPRKPQD